MRFHLSSPTDTIICPFSKCQHNSIVFDNAYTYSVHVCRIHSTDKGTVSKQNKESKIVNSEYARELCPYDYQNFIKIILFQDAFEVCNCIGATKNKFIIIAVYMIILNIPPHLRSKIDNIKLVILCFDKYIASVGWEKLLKKLVADLQELEKNGIAIFVDGRTTTFYGTFIAILGDSLGSHQIGGYTENFIKSNNCFRYCEISRDDFLNNFFRVREW